MNRESLNRESKQDDKVADRTSTFEDLHAYQVARDFRKAMYQVAKKLPQEEKFGLANQIRRAAVSLTNNIAEGHGRYVRYLRQQKDSAGGLRSVREESPEYSEEIDDSRFSI